MVQESERRIRTSFKEKEDQWFLKYTLTIYLLCQIGYIIVYQV